MDVVPYEIAMGLIYIYHEHRIYGIKCTHKIRFVPVGDDALGVPISWDFSCFVYIPCGILYGY